MGILAKSSSGIRLVACTTFLVLVLCWRPDRLWGQQFVHPFYVAVDSSGNVYVSEPERHRVQKFDSTGAFIAQWGTSGSANGQFNSPRGIAVDAAGNVYVADSGNSRIQKFTTGGAFLAKWGTFGTGATQLKKPTALALDPTGNVYVTDAELKRVKAFSGAGVLLGVLEQPGLGLGDGQFSVFQGPAGVALDGQGFVYVSDTGNNRIHKFDTSNNYIGWAGKCTSGVNCDVANQRSLGFRCTAQTCTGLGTGSGDGQFMLPSGLAFANGSLYVADGLNDRIQKFDANGFQSKWGSRGLASGQFSQPIGVAATPTTVYVADTGNNRIQKFDTAGATVMVWGGDVRLTASHGEAPGYVNPITLSPGWSQQSLVTVHSVNQFGGTVYLRASCCLDFETGLGVAPSGVTVLLFSSDVTVPANGSATALLELRASSVSRSGKYIARVRANNPAVGIDRELGVVFSVLPPAGANITLSASPGGSPGLGDLSPPKSATSTITVASVNQFSGSVPLSASCCFDVLTQRDMNAAGVSVSLSPVQVTLPPNGSQTATLTVATAGGAAFGKFFVPVKASHAVSGLEQEARVAFTVMPQSDDPPACRPSTEALPLKDALETLIRVKEENSPPPWHIAVFRKGYPRVPDARDVWRWTIEEDSTLAPSASKIVLENRTPWEKEITTAGCSAAGQTIRASSGKDAEMTITTNDRTLIFRKPVCTTWFIWCWGTAWRDVVVFPEPGFWRVFGGRKMTFRWISD